MKEEILENLISFLCKSFFVETDEIELDKSLVDQGIIDSFGLVEISGYIQREYSTTVQELEMNRENFGSVNNIVSFIERKCGSCNV